MTRTASLILGLAGFCLTATAAMASPECGSIFNARPECGSIFNARPEDGSIFNARPEDGSIFNAHSSVRTDEPSMV
jgi:hypothetical protein